MKELIVGLALCLVTGLAGAADEPDTRSPVDRYRGDGQFALLSCSLSFRLAQTEAQLNDPGPKDEHADYRGCIAKQRAAVNAQYQSFAKTLRKPKAKEALKAYHVILISTLQGIEPGDDERKMTYAQRQAAAKTRLDEAWTAFELEQ